MAAAGSGAPTSLMKRENRERVNASRGNPLLHVHPTSNTTDLLRADAELIVEYEIWQATIVNSKKD